jgi:nucleoside-diphosphate-sugar epimerase
VSRGAAYNVVDNEPVTFADYRREMARVAGAKPPLKVPYLLARLAMPYGARFLARAQLSASNERIKRELGWRPEMPTYREALASLAQGSNHSRRARR